MTSSCFKKNITIRYQNSQLNDEYSTFRNMTEILRILDINKYQLKNLTNQAEQWLEKHAFTLKHIRFHKKLTIIEKKLTSFLYNVNSLMFNDFEANHIISSLIIIVQRLLFNKKCFKQKCIEKINTSFTHTQTSSTSSSDDQSLIITCKIIKIQWASFASEFSQSQKVMSFIRTCYDVRSSTQFKT